MDLLSQMKCTFKISVILIFMFSSLKCIVSSSSVLCLGWDIKVILGTFKKYSVLGVLLPAVNEHKLSHLFYFISNKRSHIFISKIKY